MASEELEKILYVEDEPDIQKVAEMSLASLGGYTVEVCDSGEEALEVAEEFEPDLILLDVMMPEMDGPTTLLELRKIPALKNTPAAFITAKAQNEELDELLAMEGVAAIITKPFDPMGLAEEVREIWERAKNS